MIENFCLILRFRLRFLKFSIFTVANCIIIIIIIITALYTYIYSWKMFVLWV